MYGRCWVDVEEKVDVVVDAVAVAVVVAVVVVFVFFAAVAEDDDNDDDDDDDDDDEDCFLLTAAAAAAGRDLAVALTTALPACALTATGCFLWLLLLEDLFVGLTIGTTTTGCCVGTAGIITLAMPS